jgi:hypothetical protein
MIRQLIAAVLSAALWSAGAARAQQSPPASPPEPAAAATAPAAATATPANAAASRAKSRAPATQKEERDSLEPAVDTSTTPPAAPSTASARAPAAPKSGKAMDHLELGTTDITGNRELPKVLYIVPWKHSDLGDLTGKPLNSLVDQALQPIDRDVFKRENRYYGAVAQKGSAAGASQTGAAGDASRSGGRAGGSSSGDER